MICGKQIFKSRTDAANQMAGANKAKRTGINKLSQVYFCNDCNGWHISSKSVKKKKNIRPSGQTEDFTKPIKPTHRGYLVIKDYSSRKS